MIFWLLDLLSECKLYLYVHVFDWYGSFTINTVVYSDLAAYYSKVLATDNTDIIVTSILLYWLQLFL